MPKFFPVIEKRGGLIVLGKQDGSMLAKPGKCVVVDDDEKLIEDKVIDVLYGTELYRVRCKLVRTRKGERWLGHKSPYYHQALEIKRKL